MIIYQEAAKKPKWLKVPPEMCANLVTNYSKGLTKGFSTAH